MKAVGSLLILLLVFSSVIQCKHYKGAEYRTIEEYTYGRFEVRYKPANRPGVVSSFFTYHEITSETGWNEIDIEVIGRYKNMFQFNVISPGQQFHIRSNYVEFDPYEDFHDYAFEWTPAYIAYFVDGVEVYRQNGGHVSELVHPSKLMMNIWNPVYENWVGEWDDAYLPAFAEYDWARYWSYTPGTGNYGTDNNFSFGWKDDFTSFNPERWEKAEHTFGGNQADFIPENVVFNNGIMTLCLTSENDTGLRDVNPPQVMWVREKYDSSIDVLFSEEIDPVSGSVPSSYLISGVTISEALVHSNKKLVTLQTENYDPALGYNIIVRDISDDSEPANTLNVQAVSVTKMNPVSFPLKINVGGSEVGEYLADQEWSHEVEYGYMQGDVKNWGSIEINNTDLDEIYRIERKGIITYKLRVPNGTYDLKLLFAYNSSEFVAEKVFDVVVEGDLIRDNLDVSALGGMNTAYEVNTEVEVQDEIIDIYFPEEVDSNFVNAIEVDRISTGVGNRGFQTPDDFKLFQNYPNPFNGYTHFTYYLDRPGELGIKIYDLLGRIVFIKNIRNAVAGKGAFTWNAFDKNSEMINSGVYLLNATHSNKTHSMKFIYLK